MKFSEEQLKQLIAWVGKLTDPYFEWTPAPDVVPVTNPIYTHYAWLLNMLDDKREKYRDPRTMWRSIPQISREHPWKGPIEGHRQTPAGVEIVYFQHGALRMAEPWAEEMRDDLKALPEIILENGSGEGAAFLKVTLDSLADHLRFIDQGQLAPETLEFIAGREPFT